MEGPTLSDTVRKVDRAVARLEELQCILVNRNHGNVKRVPKSRIAEGGDWRRWAAPAPVVQKAVEEVVEGAQAMATRTASQRRQARPANRLRSKPEMPPASPPSSACSTNNCAGVPRELPLRQTRTSQPSTHITSQMRPRRLSQPPVAHPQPIPASVGARPKLPRTFLVDPCPRPNRPWRLSTPASSTTSSNNLATSCSSTASTIPRHRSPLLPLHNRNSLHRFDSSSAKSTPSHPSAWHHSQNLRPGANSFLLSPSPPPNKLQAAANGCPSPSPPPKKLQPRANGFPKKFQSADKGFLSPSPSPISPTRDNAVPQKLPDKENEAPSAPHSLSFPPLLCSSPLFVPPAIRTSSPSPPAAKRKLPWFSRRFSLPITPSTKSTRAALSLLAKQNAGSPQNALPSLITRLPARRKAMNSQQPQVQPLIRTQLVREAPTMDAPLPLPPALCTTRLVQKEGEEKVEEEDSLRPRHRRSRSCPRQRLLSNAGLDDSSNGAQHSELDFDGQAQRNCSCVRGEGTSCGGGAMLLPTSCFRNGEKSGGGGGGACRFTKLLQCGGSGGGCGPLRRRWSFSCLHDANNPSGGSYILKHLKGFMQTGSTSSQVYRVDSFSPRGVGGTNDRKLYTV